MLHKTGTNHIASTGHMSILTMLIFLQTEFKLITKIN
jgi:hypothetical protein